jgi:hypothetical protein
MAITTDKLIQGPVKNESEKQKDKVKRFED